MTLSVRAFSRVLALLMAVLLGTAAPQAQSLAEGFYLEDAVGDRFTVPVAVAFAPGGLMFVVEKRGVVWTVRDGELQPEPFVDLRDEVLDQLDRGLLGIAVDPGFKDNRHVYLSYVVDDGETADRDRRDAFARVTRYTGQQNSLGVADPDSRRVLIGETFSTGIPACFQSHTIGTLQFGADGTLLVGTGDAASFDGIDLGGRYDICFGDGKLDPADDVGALRSQRIESLSGKILRVDPATGLGLPSNPFWTGDADATASKVWALGLRNPYRFSVDARSGVDDPTRGRPGTIYLGDVGFSNWEDLHISRGGENFGWPCFDGPLPHDNYSNEGIGRTVCQGDLAGVLTSPTRTFHHRNPAISQPPGRTARAITGGAVQTGDRYPAAYRGAFFYGDYVEGWAALSIVGDDGELGPETPLGQAGPVVNYSFDPVGGYIYLVDAFEGVIRRLRHADERAGTAPVAAAQATPSEGGTGVRVQFSPDGSFSPVGDALSYRWAFGDGTTSSGRAPSHVYGEPGEYTATLTVGDGAAETQARVAVTVQAGSSPTIRIDAPTASARPAVGTAIPLRASVGDADQPDEGLFVRWTVTQVHDRHLHFDVFQGADAETEFVVPDHGLAGEQVYYRVRAEVRDATGLQSVDETTVFVDGDGGQARVRRGVSAVASVSQPVSGRGALTPAVVDDGVFGSAAGNPASQEFATYTGSRDSDRDWVGLAFDRSHVLSRLTFQEGAHWDDGGWFETTPRVQVRYDGVWSDVVAQTAVPAYRADDGRGYDTYEFRFAPAVGDAVRVVGAPGGAAGFVSVSELRAWALGGTSSLPEGWTSQDVGAPSAPGAANVQSGRYVVQGGGDVADDAFHLVSRRAVGVSRTTARVEPSPTAGAKSGLMLRRDAVPASPFVWFGVADGGLQLLARGGDTGAPVVVASEQGAAETEWLRLERDEVSVIAYRSADGTTWAEFERVTVPGFGAGRVLAGLAVSGGLQTASGIFDGVEVIATGVGTDDPPVSSPTVAVDAIFPNPASADVTVRLVGDGVLDLVVVDALGREVLADRVQARATASVRFDASALPAGLYLVRVWDGATGQSATRSFSVAR